MRAFLPLVLLLAACNTAEPMAARSTTSGSDDWRLEISSTGGFTGRGLGSISITGHAVEAANMSSTPCNGQLTAEEHAALARLVAAANPSAWRDVPPPRRGADMVGYTLTLRRGADSRTVTWTGEDVSALPNDLGELFTSAWRVRGRVCG